MFVWYQNLFLFVFSVKNIKIFFLFSAWTTRKIMLIFFMTSLFWCQWSFLSLFRLIHSYFFLISVDQLLIKDPTRQFLLIEYGISCQNTHFRCICAVKISYGSQIINFLSNRFICKESYCRNSRWMFFRHRLLQWIKNFSFILKRDQGCTSFVLLFRFVSKTIRNENPFA